MRNGILVESKDLREIAKVEKLWFLAIAKRLLWFDTDKEKYCFPQADSACLYALSLTQLSTYGIPVMFPVILCPMIPSLLFTPAYWCESNSNMGISRSRVRASHWAMFSFCCPPSGKNMLIPTPRDHRNCTVMMEVCIYVCTREEVRAPPTALIKYTNTSPRAIINNIREVWFPIRRLPCRPRNYSA